VRLMWRRSLPPWARRLYRAESAKVSAAKRWGIPIVNHLWLHDALMTCQLPPTDAATYK